MPPILSPRGTAAVLQNDDRVGSHRRGPAGIGPCARDRPGQQAVPPVDPHLLEWMHIPEVHSFLLTHQRYGAAPLVAIGVVSGCDTSRRGGKGVRMFSPPTDADRERRRADRLHRAELVRARGWDDYRAVWSTGPTPIQFGRPPNRRRSASPPTYRPSPRPHSATPRSGQPCRVLSPTIAANGIASGQPRRGWYRKRRGVMKWLHTPPFLR